MLQHYTISCHALFLACQNFIEMSCRKISRNVMFDTPSLCSQRTQRGSQRRHFNKFLTALFLAYVLGFEAVRFFSFKTVFYF